MNEQLVETMLATFVYPMLLQPLVIYCQRLTASVVEDRFSFSEHPFGRISADLSDVEKSLSEVAGPAKAALYTLASVFKYQSNRPLLRLLFTVPGSRAHIASKFARRINMSKKSSSPVANGEHKLILRKWHKSH